MMFSGLYFQKCIVFTEGVGIQHGASFSAKVLSFDYISDANGNISEYLSVTDGTVAAHYDYSPFGETLVASGTLASSFTHRFSTKPYCQTTGFCEYQMRKYNPNLGRWMSRDPIGELADLKNNYIFCGVIMTYDKFGCNNPSSFLDGVTEEAEAIKLVKEHFPNDPSRVAKEMKIWAKAHGLRRSSLMRTTRKYLKNKGNATIRTGGALLSAVVLIFTPTEIGAEPIGFNLPPSLQVCPQSSLEWTFMSDYKGVVCETEETFEVEEYQDSRTFWEKAADTINEILEDLLIY